MILGGDAIVLACGKGERSRAALTRGPCHPLRAMADRKVSGRGASTKKSTRLPAASTTGQRESVGQFAAVGHDLAMGLEILSVLGRRPHLYARSLAWRPASNWMAPALQALFDGLAFWSGCSRVFGL